MNRKLLHIFIFIIIAVYCVSIFIYGIKNISIYNILLFLFASPLVEEFIFRGLIQQNIYKYIKITFFNVISLANIISSLLFSLSHFLTNSSIIVTILLFLASLYLGVVYREYKSIKYSFAAHSILNIIVFINYPAYMWDIIK